MGDRRIQRLIRIIKNRGGFTVRDLGACLFVPLVLDETAKPIIAA